MKINQQNQSRFELMPEEPEQVEPGLHVPQRWDFLELSKLFGIPVAYSKPKPYAHRPHQTGKMDIWLRKDLAWALEDYPLQVLHCKGEHDLIGLCFNAYQEGYSLKGMLYDEDKMNAYLGTMMERTCKGDIAYHGNTMRLDQQLAYANLAEACGNIRGKQKYPYKPYPFLQDEDQQFQATTPLEMAVELKRLHKKYNVPVLKDRRKEPAIWYYSGWEVIKGCQGPILGCYRKELLHALMYEDDPWKTRDFRFGPGNSLKDLEELAFQCGYYQNYYPNITTSLKYY